MPKKFSFPRLPKRSVALAFISFLLGAVWFFGMRFILVDRQLTHYHANFALYIDGSRDPFANQSFYEEVVACYGNQEKQNPRHRVHMHDQVNHVVHVHEQGATWGHFLANLGYTLGNNLVETDSSIFINGADGKKLTFLLNGRIVSTVANRLIQSEDVLLINYGLEDSVALERNYTSITKDAAEYNKRNDPSACTGSDAESLGDRLKRTLGIE